MDLLEKPDLGDERSSVLNRSYRRTYRGEINRVKRFSVVDGTKNKKSAFYDILDTLFWRHSAFSDKQTFSKFTGRSYLKPRKYNLARFYDTYEAPKYNWHSRRYRNLRNRAVYYGHPDGALARQEEFYNETIGIGLREDDEGQLEDSYRYPLWYGRPQYRRRFDEALIEQSILPKPKKYVILKSVVGSCNYEFNSDISERLLAHDFVVPYFTAANYLGIGDLPNTYRTVYLGVDTRYVEPPVIPYRWLLHHKYSFTRHFHTKGFYNEDFPYMLVDNQPLEHLSSRIFSFISKNLDHIPVNALVPELDILTQLTNKRINYFKDTPNLIAQHFLNNFYHLEKYTYRNIASRDRYKYINDGLSMRTKIDVGLDYFLTYPNNSDIILDSFTKTSSDLFTLNPIKRVGPLHTDESLGLIKFEQPSLSNTPVGLNLPWAGFWFPGNIYSPFHDYDSTAYGFKARRIKKSLSFTSWDTSSNLLVFLDPQFARPVITNSILSSNGYQMVFFFSLGISVMFYFFVLLRIQVLCIWLLRYFEESDFWHLRVLLNINFYPISQFILRRVIGIAYYLFVISFIIVCWKSSLFFTLRWPYYFTMFYNKPFSSRFNEQSPLQAPIQMLSTVRRHRLKQEHLWWRLRVKKYTLRRASSTRYKRFKRTVYYNNSWFRLARNFTAYDLPTQYWREPLDRYQNLMYYGLLHNQQLLSKKVKQPFPYRSYDLHEFWSPNFHILRKRIKRKYKYKNKLKAKKFRLNFRKTPFILSGLHSKKMYFNSFVNQRHYLNPLLDQNYQRRLQPLRKTFLHLKRLPGHGIRMSLYPFSQIDAYQTVLRSNNYVLNQDRNSFGTTWRNDSRKRRARPFSSPHLFQGVSPAYLKHYWGGTPKITLFVYLAMLSQYFKLKLYQLKFLIQTICYPYQQLFDISAYIRYDNAKNRWFPGTFKSRFGRKTGRVYYYIYGPRRFARFLKAIPVRRYRKRHFIYKWRIRDTKEYKYHKRFSKRYFRRPVRLYRYHRPFFLVLSSITYYFKFASDILLPFFKLFRDHFFHIILILFLAIVAYLKQPDLQPLPSLADLGEARYPGWTRVDETWYRRKIKREAPILRPLRLKKFHYEFWTSTSSSSWRSSSCT